MSFDKFRADFNKFVALRSFDVNSIGRWYQIMSKLATKKIVDREQFKKRLKGMIASTSQGEFGQLCGVSQQTISGWNKGKRVPNSWALITLYEHTGITPNWLLLGLNSQTTEKLTEISEGGKSAAGSTMDPELQQRIDKLEAQNDKLFNQNDRLSQENERLAQRIQFLEQKLEDLGMELKNSEDEIELLRSRLSLSENKKIS